MCSLSIITPQMYVGWTLFRTQLLICFSVVKELFQMLHVTIGPCINNWDLTTTFFI